MDNQMKLHTENNINEKEHLTLLVHSKVTNKF